MKRKGLKKPTIEKAKKTKAIDSEESSIQSPLAAVIKIGDELISAKDQQFESCLNALPDCPHADGLSSPRTSTSTVLRRALSIRELDDSSWLTSSLIDLVISIFAKRYGENIQFMSVDFVVLSLSSHSKMELHSITDITGKYLNYDDPTKSFVFICNAQNIHWNLIRVIRHPHPELQLFEPMGKPTNRRGGLNFRAVPKQVIEWLDHCCPLLGGKSWLSAGLSAITKQQQYTAFDCGVACLLYAEKCGQGQVRTLAEKNSKSNLENVTILLIFYSYRIKKTSIISPLKKTLLRIVRSSNRLYDKMHWHN